MRREIFLFLFSISIFFILACMTVSGTTLPAPVATPTEFQVIIPYPNQTARPIPLPTFTPIPTKSTPEVYPAWVGDFSDPILKFVEGQHPVYHDDFPPVCIANEEATKEHPAFKVKICSTPEVRPAFQPNIWSLPVTARPTLDLQPDLQNGYTMLNTGWFFDAPDSDKNPQLAHIDSSSLILKLPEGKITRDLKIYNPHLLVKNFVLLLDLEYITIEPNDTVRLQFNQSASESFALDISRNKTWAFHWGQTENWQTQSGTYERFTPEQIRVAIIARDTKCAVYFNHDPLVYVDNCRAGALIQSSKQAVSLHLIGEPGFESVVAVDNVVLWDLDQSR